MSANERIRMLWWDLVSEVITLDGSFHEQVYSMAADGSLEETAGGTGGGAPYTITSSLEYSDSPLFGPKRERCPLCDELKTEFYCNDCVKGARYCATGQHESCSEKQLKFMHLKMKKELVEKQCLKLLEKKLKADSLNTRIRQHKERIRLYREGVKEKREKQVEDAKRLDCMRKSNEETGEKLPKYSNHMMNMTCKNAIKRERSITIRKKIAENRDAMKRLKRLRLQQLVEFIFPISIRIFPRSMSGVYVDLEETEMIKALAEASHTTYIRDKWVYTDISGELQYAIVAPMLPGSGNYTAYNDSVIQNRDQIHGNTDSMKLALSENPAYSISAAFTYTAELLNVIAYYLDIRLPYKMVYSDFCSSDMNEQQFSRRVARLNANVLHLCFSQNVDPRILHPSKTVGNILSLMDVTNDDLGRSGPMEIESRHTARLESELDEELTVGEDSDSESGDVFSYESWEAVPHVQCPEVPPGPLSFQQSQTQTMTAQQTNSIAGGLYTSAAASIVSIWRGFTGR